MAFIGRNKELQRLDSLYESRQDVLMLMTGRKTVGKTTLLRHFAEDKKTLFYPAANISDALNRKAFAACLNQYSETEVAVSSKSLPTWREMLKAFAELSGKNRKLLIIDNFDLLIQGDSDILTIFKNCWYNELQPKDVMVILVFHEGRMLMNLKYEGKAFLLAVTHRMQVNPISFMEMMRDYQHYDFNQLIMQYSITGGVPHYFNYFHDCQDRDQFFEAIRNFTMNPFGDLFTEPANLLEYEVGNPSGYHSVFLAMASGRKSLSEIAGFCGIKESRVEELLKYLTTVNLVADRISIFEKKVNRKTIQYSIKDPFFAFWYTFVFPYFEELKNGEDQKAEKHLADYFDDYVRQWFRRTALATFKSAGRSNSIPMQCTQIGTFRNKDAEVDVVGIDHDKKEIFLGECSYQDGTYNQERFNEFKAKCENIREFRQYKDYNRTYGVFSNNPFDKDLAAYALENKGVLLFNGINIYSLNV